MGFVLTARASLAVLLITEQKVAEPPDLSLLVACVRQVITRKSGLVSGFSEIVRDYKRLLLWTSK